MSGGGSVSTTVYACEGYAELRAAHRARWVVRIGSKSLGRCVVCKSDVRVGFGAYRITTSDGERRSWFTHEHCIPDESPAKQLEYEAFYNSDEWGRP
jgi:hypothetical protein